MYLTQEELKEARERRETVALNETAENEETKTPEQRCKEAEKRLYEAMEREKEFKEKYKKTRDFVEDVYKNDFNKDLIFSLLLAILVNEKQVRH